MHLGDMRKFQGIEKRIIKKEIKHLGYVFNVNEFVPNVNQYFTKHGE